MSTLNELYSEIDKQHTFELCSDPPDFEALERQYGYPFPEDLKSFYRRYRSVKLFDSEYGATYRFVSVNEIHPTRLDIYGKNAGNWGPGTWLTICDVLDGNYIAIDIASGEGETYNYIDCFHETFAVPGESSVIARSLIELLAKALWGGGDRVFYLQNGFIGYGDGLPLTIETAARRIENPEAPEKGWLVAFTIKGIPHSLFIGDKEYGGTEAALEAVKRYIDQHK